MSQIQWAHLWALISIWKYLSYHRMHFIEISSINRNRLCLIPPWTYCVKLMTKTLLFHPHTLILLLTLTILACVYKLLVVIMYPQKKIPFRWNTTKTQVKCMGYCAAVVFSFIVAATADLYFDNRHMCMCNVISTIIRMYRLPFPNISLLFAHF